MSMPFVTNLDRIQTLLNASHNLSKPYKHWHSAFVSIYCSRAIFSHFINNQKTSKLSPTSSFTAIDINTDHPFSVSQDTLTNLLKEKNVEILQSLGGVHGVTSALKIDIENGVKAGNDDDDNNDDILSDVIRRRNAFGANTYPKAPTIGFFHFVIEGFKDPTILILLVCAALTLFSMSVFRSEATPWTGPRF